MMKTSQNTINQLGLQTIKTIVLLMAFMGCTFLLSNITTSSFENTFEHYEENADVLKILHD